MLACASSPAMEQIGMGDQASEQHQWGEAISYYQKAIAADSQLTEAKIKLALAYSNRGWDYNNQKKWDDAIEDLDKSLNYNPESAIAYNNRGLAWDGKGQEQLSIAYDYLNINGDKDSAKIEMENAIDSFTNSISDLNKALKLKNNFEEAIFNLAHAYNDRGHTYNLLKEFDKAIPDLIESIKLNPDLAEAYNDLGWAYNGKKDWQKALPECTKAIELNNEMALAYNNRGWAYHELNDFNKALIDLDKAIELMPGLSVAYLNRAITYYYLKNVEKVVEKVLELTNDPDQEWSAKQVASLVGVDLKD